MKKFLPLATILSFFIMNTSSALIVSAASGENVGNGTAGAVMFSSYSFTLIPTAIIIDTADSMDDDTLTSEIEVALAEDNMEVAMTLAGVLGERHEMDAADVILEMMD